MPLLAILVEDSEIIRDNLVVTLDELAGVEVFATADTAAEAIKLLEAHSSKWRLAIVDLFLKEGSGLTVLRACRDRRADQHVIVLTNYPTEEMRRRCEALGADALFDKSTQLDAFLEKCRAYV